MPHLTSPDVSYNRDLERVRAWWSGGIREAFKSRYSVRQTRRFLVGRALRPHLHYEGESEQQRKRIYFSGVWALRQTTHDVQLLSGLNVL